MTRVKTIHVVIAGAIAGFCWLPSAHGQIYSSPGTACQHDAGNSFQSGEWYADARGMAHTSQTQSMIFTCPLITGTTNGSVMFFDAVYLWYRDNSLSNEFSCRVWQGFGDGTSFFGTNKYTCQASGGCWSGGPSGSTSWTGYNYFAWSGSELTAHWRQHQVDGSYGIDCTLPKVTSGYNWITSYYAVHLEPDE